ncbi:MAG: hypothetical protein LAT67_01230 [Balneolales bacterium]|nr:hypothetical protein [Balneolales bacterium]
MQQDRQQLRNQLKKDVYDRDRISRDSQKENNFTDETDGFSENRKSRSLRTYIAFALIGMFLLWMTTGGNNSFSLSNLIPNTSHSFSPSNSLVEGMGLKMIEMGYGELSDEYLRELRRDGLTATYIANVRAAGYPDLTIDEALRLVRAGASSRFISMMIELGYSPTIDELVSLRDAGVTAHFTSNMYDLGFQDIPIDQLIRLQRIGVTASLAERLQNERGTDVSLEEIIRYRISNQ